jgi:methylmalonyl-CoA mutase
MGGMTKAVESGWAKLQVEKCATEKQARIDSGRDVIVGVNKYRLKDEDKLDVREIDNVAVRESQVRSSSASAPARQRAVDAALAALTAAESGKGNLLELSVNAMRVRATVGEVSMRWKGMGPSPRRRRRSAACIRPSWPTTKDGSVMKDDIAPVRRRRGPPAAHHDRQARPGRP